jgi:elongation factor P
MIDATEIRKGMVIKLDERVYTVLKVDHLTPGNKRAIIQVRLRDLQSGIAMDHRFSSSDRVEQPFLEQIEMEYLYCLDDILTFMNHQNYDELQLSKDLVGDDMNYLKENTMVKVNFCDGRPIGIELPASVALQVVQTEPPLKGATITNVYKPAKLETGLVISVPPFIKEGELIRVDTRQGRYLERVGGQTDG